MRIRITPRAFADLEAIRLHIEQNNPDAAWAVASFIRRSIRTLEDFPRQGRATKEPSIRRLVVKNYPYIIYYRVSERFVSIITITHTAQEK